jgi:hypothetical protein
MCRCQIGSRSPDCTLVLATVNDQQRLAYRLVEGVVRVVLPAYGR